MNHLIIAPIIVPAVVAALILLGLRHRVRGARTVSLVACATLVVIAAMLTIDASSGRIQSYAVGNWPAPYGIVLVLDRLAAAMVLLTAVLALLVLWHASATGLDRRGWHFHSLFHFQLLGLNGAFLTGDLFNLFVFFEVLLIASYGLMLHGQGPARLKAGVQYVVVNLVGSTLFLIALGILYGTTGTLNMVDMAGKVAAAPPGDVGLIRAGAALLFVVFALKAALLPLHLWLPRTYASTSAPVAALFAILTKVGVYAIIRTTMLIFGDAAGAAAWPAAPWMLPAALLTAVVGFAGMLAAHRLRELAAFGVIGSTGTLLAATATFAPAALSAALYYLLHSTLAGAMLFLVSDVVARRRDGYGDALAPGPRFCGAGALSLLFLLAAVALVGLPPLSGFVGKLLILNGVRAHTAWPWIWSVVLGTTIIGVLALARAGSTVFWKHVETGPGLQAPSAGSRTMILPLSGVVVALGALTLFAGAVTAYANAAAAQLNDTAAYAAAVLGSGG